VRGLAWVLGLAAAAVLLALVLQEFHGNVVFMLPPYRVDMSLAAFLLAVAAVFVLLYAALKLIGVVTQLPVLAAEFRKRRQHDENRDALVAAVVDLASGRFSRALQAATRAKAQPELKDAALLIGAQAAHRLRDRVRRDEALKLAEDTARLKEAAVLTAAQAALDDRDPQAALAALNRLDSGPARRVQALRLKLQAARLAGRNDEVLRIAPMLQKHHDLSPDAAQALAEQAALDQLHDARHDLDQLQRSWQRIAQKMGGPSRAKPRLAIAASQHFAALSASADARRVLTVAIDASAPAERRPLFIALAEVLSGADSTFLAQLERWHKESPRDEAAALLAGVACRQMELWGKARQYLAVAMHSDDAHLHQPATLALAQLEDQLGNHEAAQPLYKKAALAQTGVRQLQSAERASKPL
jgi:HemY protein